MPDFDSKGHDRLAAGAGEPQPAPPRRQGGGLRSGPVLHHAKVRRHVVMITKYGTIDYVKIEKSQADSHGISRPGRAGPHQERHQGRQEVPRLQAPGEVHGEKTTHARYTVDFTFT